jgi:hypothetical protein
MATFMRYSKYLLTPGKSSSSTIPSPEWRRTSDEWAAPPLHFKVRRHPSIGILVCELVEDSVMIEDVSVIGGRPDRCRLRTLGASARNACAAARSGSGGRRPANEESLRKKPLDSRLARKDGARGRRIPPYDPDRSSSLCSRPHWPLRTCAPFVLPRKYHRRRIAIPNCPHHRSSARHAS